MHALSFASVFALALSAAAYQITSPNNSTGWTSTGTNTLSWSRVATDPLNFTVILTNTDRSVMPTNNLLLAPFVDGTTQTSVSISPPSGGLPVGGSFRVNLVKDQSEQSTIYAQSDEFNIVSGGTASASSTVSTTGAGSTSAPGSTITVGDASQTPGGVGTATNSGLNPTQSKANSAISARASVGVMGAFMLLGVFLA